MWPAFYVLLRLFVQKLNDLGLSYKKMIDLLREYFYLNNSGSLLVARSKIFQRGLRLFALPGLGTLHGG